MARKRIVLNNSTVREIQSLAPSFADILRRGYKSRLSIALAARFGVNAKTIRDIWNRRSWTRSNETENERTAYTETTDGNVLDDLGSPGTDSEACITLNNLDSPGADSEVWDSHIYWQDLFD